jgi:hypothetical protein
MRPCHAFVDQKAVAIRTSLSSNSQQQITWRLLAAHLPQTNNADEASLVRAANPSAFI